MSHLQLDISDATMLVLAVGWFAGRLQLDNVRYDNGCSCWLVSLWAASSSTISDVTVVVLAVVWFAGLLQLDSL